MRLKKRVVSIMMATAMVFSSAFGSVSVNAQKPYDPMNTEKGNHGIYLDASAVPEAGDDIEVEYNSDHEARKITARRNVKFQLYCPVDAEWRIEPADKGVSIGVDGMVKIDTGAAGNYKIVAKAQNVEQKALDYELDTDLAVKDGDPARAEKILFDEVMNDDQVKVTNDGQTLEINGKVTNKQMLLKYEPEYILDGTVSFQDSKDPNIYALSGENNTLISTGLEGEDKDKPSPAEGVTIAGQIGTTDATLKTNDSLKVVVKEVELENKIVCRENPTTDCEMELNQEINYDVQTNGAVTLPYEAINKVEWSLKQKDVLTSTAKEEISYTVLDKEGNAVLDAEGNPQTVTEEHDVYEIKSNDGEVVATVYASERHISIVTKKTVENTEASVPALTIAGKYWTTSDNAGNNASFPDITVKFNLLSSKAATRAFIDFERAGMVKGVDFSIKEKAITVDGEEQDVYYLEADDSILDLTRYTFADVNGVKSFNESKENAFADKQPYTVSYLFEELPATGTLGTAQKYNMELDSEEITDEGILKDNTIFTRKNIGYVKLTVMARTGGNDLVSDVLYLRFVSPASDLLNALRISKHDFPWYALDQGEVVHICQGESVIPGDYEKVGDTWKLRHSITDENPFIEYEITDTSVAKASSVNGEYRISGLSEGIVTVKAVGAVNKTQTASFTLYVNKDYMDVGFYLSFTDAQDLKYMESNVIKGKQSNVPVSVQVLDANGGVPKLTWSLSCTEDIATIDENGRITTYKSSGGEEITVTAVSQTGKDDTATFTIERINATRITEIAEAPDESGKTILTDVQPDAGTCKVGQSFKLYPSSYEPANATDLADSSIKWSSGDENLAKVDAASGLVTAIAETGASPVVITATYTEGGKAPTTKEFKLTIKGNANVLTAIDAEDITLPYVGATANINVTFIPESAANKNVTYISDDTTVAKVSTTGVVTAQNAGNCKIKIISAEDTSISKTINVTVEGNSSQQVNPGASSKPGVSSKPGASSKPGVSSKPDASSKPSASSEPSASFSPSPSPSASAPAGTQVPAAPAAPSAAPASPAVQKGTTQAVKGVNYEVTNPSSKTVTVKGSKNAKKVTIGGTVTIQGEKYKVTAIKANAFKNNKKLKSVVIGSNVKTIGKQAFYGCTKLTKVTIQSKVLNSVGAKAFAKGAKKVTVTVPKKKASKYKKMLKKAKISKKAKYKKK